MKFKSNAKYNEGLKTGSIFSLKSNSLGIVIHKYAGCGDSLFLSSSTLNIDNYDLETEDFDEAVSKAKENELLAEAIGEALIKKMIFQMPEDSEVVA